MATSYDLTTVDGLRNYLHEHGDPAIDKITMLTGGTANYVYRVTDSTGTAKVYKHAAPYSHSNKDFALDVRRMDYEAHILELQSATTSQQAPRYEVHTVDLISYDKEQKLLCIEDGGSRNLKAAYDDAELNMCKIGEGLAHWLASLHCTSRDISLALPAEKYTTNHPQNNSNNNPVALLLYRHAYTNLHLALSQFGHDKQLGVRIDNEYGALIASDDECICHGDFWPGNILLQRARVSKQESTTTTTTTTMARLTVVDWELVRRGTSATDVGQFAAEAFLLDRFKGGRGLFAAFLAAYVKARETGDGGAVDSTWFRRMVVHCAVHVAYWPTRVAWTDREGTQELVDMGVEVMEAALENDWEKLLGSRLLLGVKDTCEVLLAG